MGGDQAPGKILEGAVAGLSLLDAGDEMILVGDEAVIRAAIGPALEKYENLRIEHASQVITMEDSPAKAIRGKPDSSIVKMVKLGRGGGADALISAGNTGALVAAGTLMLGRLAGVDRPGIAVMLPSSNGFVMMCDAGANTEPKPEHFHQYAVMSSLYVSALRGIESPRVGILNIGTEDEKGTPIVKAARDMIKADASINYMGYVEGRDIPHHPCDVLITDGFTGNVVLKVAEGFATSLIKSVQHEITAEGPELMARAKPALGRLLRKFDHEEVGGALLLGVSGIFFKVHGSGGARAIKNAVQAAKAAGKLEINKKIEARLAPKV
jgi:glycerol-3-phosphate acyltransferase PlsX